MPVLGHLGEVEPLFPRDVRSTNKIMEASCFNGSNLPEKGSQLLFFPGRAVVAGTVVPISSDSSSGDETFTRSTGDPPDLASFLRLSSLLQGTKESNGKGQGRSNGMERSMSAYADAPGPAGKTVDTSNLTHYQGGHKVHLALTSTSIQRFHF